MDRCTGEVIKKVRERDSYTVFNNWLLALGGLCRRPLKTQNCFKKSIFILLVFTSYSQGFTVRHLSMLYSRHLCSRFGTGFIYNSQEMSYSAMKGEAWKRESARQSLLCSQRNK